MLRRFGLAAGLAAMVTTGAALAQLVRTPTLVGIPKPDVQMATIAPPKPTGDEIAVGSSTALVRVANQLAVFGHTEFRTFLGGMTAGPPDFPLVGNGKFHWIDIPEGPLLPKKNNIGAFFGHQVNCVPIPGAGDSTLCLFAYSDARATLARLRWDGKKFQTVWMGAAGKGTGDMTFVTDPTVSVVNGQTVIGATVAFGDRNVNRVYTTMARVAIVETGEPTVAVKTIASRTWQSSENNNISTRPYTCRQQFCAYEIFKGGIRIDHHPAGDLSAEPPVDWSMVVPIKKYPIYTVDLVPVSGAVWMVWVEDKVLYARRVMYPAKLMGPLMRSVQPITSWVMQPLSCVADGAFPVCATNTDRRTLIYRLDPAHLVPD